MKPASCADDFTYYLKVDDQGQIVDLSFDGVGCTIATASSSIMTELIKGTSVEKARQIITQYRLMIEGKPYDRDVLNEAVVFQNTSRQPARIKCATIGYDAVEMMLNQLEGKK
jgi:nitrogen fixation NifU-like protein